MKKNGHSHIQGWGADAKPENRPGVPMEWKPEHPLQGSHWTEPERQSSFGPVLHSRSRPLTPVFSNLEPPKGLSGVLRTTAYQYADHQARHWLILMLADRVDAVESLLARRPYLALAPFLFVGAGIWRAGIWRKAR